MTQTHKLALQEGHLRVRIKENFPNLTKSQKLVAEYLLREYQTAGFLTASQLAKKIGVSEATVIRFTRALEFDGYPNLQQTLQSIIKYKLTTITRLKRGIEQMQGDADIVTKICQADMRNLSNTFRDLSKETFEKVVNAIHNARRVFIIGLRTSASLALFLYLSLRYIHKETQLITPGVGDIYEQLIFSSSKDLAFAISFPRYAKQTVELLKDAREREIRTVALTDSLVSPLAQHADYVLTAHYQLNSFVESFIGALSLINALVTAVAAKDEAKSLEALKNQEQIWEKFGIYFNW